MGIFAPTGAAGYLAYASITSSVNTTSTSDVAISGLSINPIIPAGGRYVKITAFGFNMYCIVSGQVSLYSGATSAALTNLIGRVQCEPGSGNASPMIVMAVQQPSAGSIWYTLAYSTSNVADAINIQSGAGYPTFILAEGI